MFQELNAPYQGRGRSKGTYATTDMITRTDPTSAVRHQHAQLIHKNIMNKVEVRNDRRSREGRF